MVYASSLPNHTTIGLCIKGSLCRLAFSKSVLSWSRSDITWRSYQDYARLMYWNALGHPHPRISPRRKQKHTRWTPRYFVHAAANRGNDCLINSLHSSDACGEAIFTVLHSHGLVDTDDPKLWQSLKDFTESPFPARHLVDVGSYHYLVDLDCQRKKTSASGSPPQQDVYFWTMIASNSRFYRLVLFVDWQRVSNLRTSFPEVVTLEELRWWNSGIWAW